MAQREAISLELDVEIASMLKAHAEVERVSEGEIVERALRAFDLRTLVNWIRSRSDLDEEAAMRLVGEELRAERDSRAA